MTTLPRQSELCKPDRPRVACAHCGLDVPPALIEPDDTHQFCCSACRTVFEAINACGLDEYYALRDRLGADGAPAVSGTPSDLEVFDDARFLERHAAQRPDGSCQIDLLLEGVHCAACMWLIERLPRIVDGVLEARLDLGRSVVSVAWDPARAPLSRVARGLLQFGYRPHPLTSSEASRARTRQDREYLVRIGVAGACAGNVMLLAFALYSGHFTGIAEPYHTLFRLLSAGLGVLSIAWPGSVFFRGAVAAIRARAWHLDMPIALALGVGAGVGAINAVRGSGEIYFDSLTMLVFLLLMGRWMQIRQQRQAIDSIELLYALTPSVAHEVAGDDTRDVPADTLEPGTIVEIRAHESAPVDGIVIAGASAVDASILTGESRPVRLDRGDDIAAGSVVLSAPLRVRVTATGRQTRLGRMLATVEELSRRRLPVIGAADRIAGPFVCTVLVLAAVTLALWWSTGIETAADRAIALLIVACPCAVGLATPLASTVAIGRLARRGLLVKGGDVLEALSRRGTMIVDKTGTLTEGKFTVLDWVGDQAVRPLVAAAERGSSHPIAVALAGDQDTPGGAVEAVEQHTGLGLVATVDGTPLVIGSPAFVASRVADVPAWARDAVAAASAEAHTPVVVAAAGAVRAVAVLGDRVRRDAPAAMARLRADGWRLVLASGDQPEVARAVGSMLGVTDARGGMSPEDKRELVESVRASGPVVMLGDGVNDAPALAGADVGIAVHGGAEASMTAADAYVQSPGLTPVLDLLDASRRTVRTIRRALAVAVTYNATASVLAMAGFVGPIAAAIIMPVTSATVVAIAIRARTFRDEPTRRQPARTP